MSSTAPSSGTPSFSTNESASSTEAAGPITSAPSDSSEAAKSAATRYSSSTTSRRRPFRCSDHESVIDQFRRNRHKNSAVHAVRPELKLCLYKEVRVLLTRCHSLFASLTPLRAWKLRSPAIEGRFQK